MQLSILSFCENYDPVLVTLPLSQVRGFAKSVNRVNLRLYEILEAWQKVKKTSIMDGSEAYPEFVDFAAILDKGFQ